MRIEEATFVVVDTETTGSRAGDDRLIEVGAVKMRGGEVLEQFQQLVNPGRHVPRRITELTGISTAMVYRQPRADEVLPRFLEFLGDAVLVAHNLPFDQRVLNEELDLAGLDPLRNDGLCTLRLARRLLSALPSKGLTLLAEHLGIEIIGRHRALGDASATATLLLKLADRLVTEFEVRTIDDLLAFQRRRYAETRREPAHLIRIRRDVLPGLPDRPGVYFMRDRAGRVIYVGKAKSLRHRVRSYFVGVENHPPRTRRLLREVRDVSWEETGTELAALLQESRLIKHLLPHHNQAQRAYRDYPFLRLDTTHAFPTLSWTPRVADDGAEYYGPLGRRGQAEDIVELVARLFKLRECDDHTFAMGRPCFYHEMGRCSAPCTGAATSDYQDIVERVRRFLTGREDAAAGAVERAMVEAAARREYELAAWYRDQLRRLQRALTHQQQVAGAVHDLHAVLVEPHVAAGRAQLFVMRYGRLVARVDAGPDDAVRVAEALDRHFDPAVPRPRRFERHELDEIRILAHWMRVHADSTLQVRWFGDIPAAQFHSRVMAAVHAATHASWSGTARFSGDGSAATILEDVVATLPQNT
jgi:DNA polymerase-3 subunit epsilon